MKLFSRLRDHRYCAYCKSPRRVYLKKHVDLTNVVAVILLSLVITQSYWGEPDPRGFVLFCLLIFVAEIFVYLRWRAAITCRLCGFDPVVYKRSPERASALVSTFFKQQSENPEFWLTKSPLLEVHRRIQKQERTKQQYTDRGLRRQSKTVARPPVLR